VQRFLLVQKSDIGFLFYVYDFKFSGEHRVRLVFDGSRQSASTYSETYAPTVQAESVRRFHIVCVEEGYHIGPTTTFSPTPLKGRATFLDRS
jgi:hypothetical protein